MARSVDETPTRAKAWVCRQERLDEETKAQMWDLFRRYYAGVTSSAFRSDLAEKSHVILLSDPAGHVVGFSTLCTYAVPFGRRRIRVLFSGDTIIDRPYWGDRGLQHAFGRFMTRYRLRHPFAPMYWLLISKGYRTYLLLSRNFRTYWPRHDRPMPKPKLALLAALAQERFGARWDGSRGIVRAHGDTGRLRDGVVPVPDTAATAADIRFFHEQNPGHADGDELVCLGRITAGLWFRYAWRKMRRPRVLAAAHPKAQGAEGTG